MDQAAYLDQLQQLLPPGSAIPRDPDATFTRLLAAIADELARVDARADRLHDEADPRTALELLPDWERVVGLPDACAPAIAATVPERRAAIVAKLTARGGQSIAYLTALAASMAFPIVIDEAAPLRVGHRVGARCAGPDWAFTFIVTLLPGVVGSAAETWLRAGTARAGDRIRSFGNAGLECAINRAKPAHTIVIFAYPADPAPAFLFDFTL